MKKYKKQFIESEPILQYLLLALSLSIKGIVLLFPYLLQRLIDAVTVGNRADMNHFAVLSIALVFVYIPMLAYYGYKLEMSEVIMIQRLRKNLMNKTIFMDFNRYFEKEPGYFFQRFVNDCENVRYLFYERKIRLVSNVVYLIAIFYMMIRYSMVLTIVSCILILILSALSYFYLPKISKAQNELMQKEERVTGCFEEGLSGFELVRNYQAENYVINRMDDMLNQWRDSVKIFTRKDVFYDFILALFLIQLTDSLIYWIGGDSILNGNLTFGALTAFSIYFSRLRDVVDNLMGIPKKTTLAKVSEERIVEVLSLEDEKSLDHEMEALDTLLMKGLSYKVNNKIILDHLNIRIERGGNGRFAWRERERKNHISEAFSKVYPTHRWRNFVE